MRSIHRFAALLLLCALVTSSAFATIVSGSTQQVATSAVHKEPAIISKPTSYGSLILSAHMKFTSGIPLIRYTSVTNSGTYSGDLPMPTGGSWAGGASNYVFAADPVLALDSGGTLYCAGLVGSTSVNPTGIAVWSTTATNADSWSNPVPAVSVSYSGNPALVVDKPSIATGSGYVYVAYTYVVGGSSSIYFARSTGGTNSFNSPVCASTDGSGNCTSGNFHSSALVVDGNGYLYMFYLDVDGQKIRRAVSTNNGSSWWNPDSSGYVANNVLPVLKPLPLSGGMVAPTTLSATYNAYANKLAVVWHQYDGSESQPTEMFIATKAAGQAWSVQNIKILGTVGNPQSGSAAGDQFLPAVAADVGGGLMVSFYSRHATGNNDYRTYDVYLDSSGAQVVTHPIEQLSSSAAGPGDIGDYQWIHWDNALSVYHIIWVTNNGSTTTVYRAQAY